MTFTFTKIIFLHIILTFTQLRLLGTFDNIDDESSLLTFSISCIWLTLSKMQQHVYIQYLNSQRATEYTSPSSVNLWHRFIFITFDWLPLFRETSHLALLPGASDMFLNILLYISVCLSHTEEYETADYRLHSAMKKLWLKVFLKFHKWEKYRRSVTPKGNQEGKEKRESNEKIVMLGKYWNSCQ